MNSICDVLVSLGVHIGHLRKNTLSSNNSFLLGSRHGVELLNIKSTIHSLRKALNFLHQVGKMKGDLLFHITSLPDYGPNIHFFFVHLIAHQHKQRIFDEKWVFGQFGNIRHHALSLIFQLFFIQRRKFNLYVSKNHKRAVGYRSNLLMRYGIRKRRGSNYLRRLRRRRMRRLGYAVPRFVRKYRHRKYNVLNKGSRTLKKHKLLNFITFYDLFVRVLFYSYFKRIKGVSFDLHFNKMLKFFKFVLVFKYFRTFLIMPDVFVLTNSNNLSSPVLEVLNMKIPIVGLIDSNSDSFGITYPIYSNDDNILLSIFYFKLFLKSYEWGKMKRFLSIKVN